MSAQINQDGSVTITAYSLVELLPDVVQASKDGFELDFVNNAGYPQNFGTVTVLTMFPEQKEATHSLIVDGVQVGNVSNLQVQPLNEVIESVKLEGSVSDYFKEEVKPIPLGEVAPPVKVDKRRKQV